MLLGTAGPQRPAAPPAASSHTERGIAVRKTAVQQAFIEPQAASGHDLRLEEGNNLLLLLRV